MNAYILTFGCQMNEYDSEILESLLAGKGFNLVAEPGDADLIVVNTCSVRRKAEERAIARISSLAALKRNRRDLTLVVAGCMARRAGSELLERIPEVDLVIGPDRIPDLPDIIEEKNGRQVLIDETDGDAESNIVRKQSGPQAYLAISRGCENYCSYCIVPYVRGSFRCRPLNSIISQYKSLVGSGVKEITLLGQNVNSYSYDGVDFPGLLRILDGLAKCRLRFLTSHPKDLSDDLVACFSELTNLCRAIHLPLQSGSDSVLEAMNRGYTVDRYMNIVAKLREAAPEITLTTDIIVGYPNESREDFEKTLAVVRAVEFDSAFMFRYSVRPGTKSAQTADVVEESEKIDRLTRLIKIQQEITKKKARAWIGKTVEVLITGESRRKPPRPAGITRGGQKLLIRDEVTFPPGELVMAEVVETSGKTLIGNLVLRP